MLALFGLTDMIESAGASDSTHALRRTGTGYRVVTEPPIRSVGGPYRLRG